MLLAPGIALDVRWFHSVLKIQVALIDVVPAAASTFILLLAACLLTCLPAQEPPRA